MFAKSFCIFFLLSCNYLKAQDTAAYNLALKCFKNDEKLKALDICNDMISKDNKYVDAYVLRGGLYLDLGSPGDALIDFNTALMLHPDYFDALIGRGMYYQQTNSFDEAIADFNKAESINDTQIILFYNRNILYDKMQLFEKNIQQLSKGIKLYPNNVFLYKCRTYAYLRNKQIDSAKADAVHALKIDSTDVASKINLGFCYIVQKEFKKANSIYETLNINSSSHPYILSNYGFVLFKIGKKIEGLDFIYQSLKILPENAFAHRYLAEISIEENEIESACYHIKKSLNLGYTKDYGNEVELMRKKYCKD